ncbi:hypothetical protein HYN56_16495 [Flavobacterium crocinum]|uniref:Thiopeptide-type bacteriocin biosynthesis domain-containing protein n=1 Tax=Flavobacterium crocinum TaxID=2183896 RepID=A0A2S1YNU0_9FLAO|nr:thiopeptide-type bacteriocin biosynthesis protein [Flavobacterium crocinum]AWK05749.1 hypothetical protein HYN56_16495 [Flavobacterium crocinum]
MQRDFITGDSWVYFKIYTGYQTSEKILIDIIRPAADFLITEKIIDKWFFVRYSDPDYHLRVRFECTKKEDYFKVISFLHNPLKEEIDKGTIWNIQLDTYKRELERYAEETILLSEELFFHESLLITDFIKNINQTKDEELRWLLALVLIDNHLEVFSLTMEEKFRFMKKLKDNFHNEFTTSKMLKKQISERYRKEKNKIKHFFDQVNDSESDNSINKTLIKYNDSIKLTINNISDIISVKSSLENELLYMTYIHMSMNRLFKSYNRRHELVCYDFLYNFYSFCVHSGKNVKSEKIYSKP